MKILVVANDSMGVYKFRKELLAEVIKRSHEVYLVVPQGEYIKELQKIGVSVIETKINRRGKNPLNDLGLMFRYYTIIKEINPDKIITYTIKPNIFAGIVSRFLNIEYYQNITGLGTAFQKPGPLKNLVVNLYKISSKNAKVIFFENSENKQIFVNLKIAKKEQCCSLNGAGVNLEKFSFVEYPEKMGKTIFLFVGRIMKEKGIAEFLAAAKNIKRVYPATEFQIMGYCEDNYIQAINELEEQNIVTFLGFQKDIIPFIERCSCFVLPSYHEGMSNALLEAGALGRPLLTSDIPGCREAVVDGGNGFLFKSRDAQSLEEVLVKFLQLDEDDRKRMGKISRKIISKNFDKKKIIAETLEKINIQ